MTRKRMQTRTPLMHLNTQSKRPTRRLHDKPQPAIAPESSAAPHLPMTPNAQGSAT